MTGGANARVIGAVVTAAVLAFYLIAFFFPEALPAILAVAVAVLALLVSRIVISRIRLADIWVLAQRHRHAGEWSAALASLDTLLEIKPSHPEANVLRLVMLLNLKRDDHVTSDVMRAVSRILELDDAPRRDFLESYARLLGGLAFAAQNEPGTEVPSTYWYDPVMLANPRVRRLTRLALPSCFAE